MIHKFYIIILLLSLSQYCIAQSDNCECASYNSLQYRTDYETILSPALIKEKGINEVLVNINGEDIYREMKFSFNKDGHVILKTSYNRKGKPHSTYKYERNSSGKIIKQTFNYIDSLEQKSSFSTPEITDFTYDDTGRLIKIKERDRKGEIRIDKESDYTKYQYDGKGRKISETRQYYYEGSEIETSVYSTDFKYDEDTFEGVSKTYEDSKLFITTKTKYNRKWKSLASSDFNNLMNEAASEITYAYDDLFRLIRFETKVGNGSFSECPDGGTFHESYKFSNEGFLMKIEHAFENTICEMIFEYIE